jgi:hypothetical protein
VTIQTETVLGVSKKATFLLLLVVNGILIALHLVAEWLRVYGEDRLGRQPEGTQLFDMDAEVSVPTWWSQLLLFGVAVLAFVLARAAQRENGRDHRYWFALSGLFLFLSLDDGTELHERFAAPLQDAFGTEVGPFRFAWVILAIPAVTVFVVAFYRFWARQPARPRVFLAIGVAVSVVGAVGFEMITAVYVGGTERYDYGYSLLSATEEGLENLGSSLLIFTLLWLLQIKTGSEGVTVRVDD